MSQNRSRAGVDLPLLVSMPFILVAKSTSSSHVAGTVRFSLVNKSRRYVLHV
jgi:hypothetical protein